MDYNKVSKEELIKLLSDKDAEVSAYEAEIKKLEHDLVKVNKKLQEADSLKSHFVSNISNEIVNPFTSVLALADNILKVDKESWKSVISMVALIHSEVFHLDFQLKNIFAAAKLEAGEITPEISTIEIDSLIKNVIESFKYDARHKGLQVIYQTENKAGVEKVFFKSDSEKITLIISNLLSNAIKFSFNNNKIILRAVKSIDKLMIEVQDFGVGISHENENIIFDRFKRADSGINSINRGHGLGLSVNKAMLDILDGTISFTSKLNEGATFIVNIPESKGDSTGISRDAGEIFFKEEKF
ncbi:MAG TPA: histidine kinase [Bacteroidales bacterium]|jgi:signal transduction histidine kinase|nr:histidine kinase [Bacteroidales bacterium]